MTIIEMYANSHHRIKYCRRRLNVLNSCFDRPGSIAGYINSLLDTNGQILMPDNEPVSLGRLGK